MPTSVYDPKQEDDKKFSHASNPGAEHERRMLEDMYNAPSASNSGSDKLSRKDIADKERMEDAMMQGYGANINKSEKDAVGKAANPDENTGWKPSDGSDQVGKGFNKGSKSKGKWSGKKKTIAGWAAGLILAMGAGGGVTGVLSGPAQFVQAANLMQGLHMEEAENTADNRLFLLARYIREPNKPQNLRMGIVANKYADKIELRMNSSGITSGYTEKLGFLNGYVIDKSKLSGDFKQLRKASDADVIQRFQETYGVKVEVQDGKLFADGAQFNSRSHNPFVRDFLQTSGSGRVSGAVQARMMGHRAGIDWHPMKSNNKTLRSLEARFLKWKENRKLKISQGVEATRPQVKKEVTDDGKSVGNADDVESVIDETIAEGDEAKTSGDTTDLNKKLNGIKTSAITGIGAVGVVCLINGIAQNVDNVEQAQIAKPLIRMYGDLIAFGNQIMFGDGDVDVEQMGFMQEQMYDKKTKTSWDQAMSIQAQTGQNQSGEDLAGPLKPGGSNAVVNFFGDVPGLDATCSAAGTGVGQVVMTLAGGLNVANAAITGAFYLFGDAAIDALSRWIAGEPVNPFLAGAQYGAAVDYGGKLAAADQGLTVGGRELNGTETIQADQVRSQTQEHEFKQRPLAYRLFETTDSRSLAGSLIQKQRPDAQANMAAMANNIVNFGSTIMSLPQNLFSQKVSAVRDYKYPDVMKDVGFSNDELDSAVAKEDPFTNACKVAGCPEKGVTGLLEGEQGEDYLMRIKNCFELEVTPSDGTVTSTGAMPQRKIRAENDCNNRGTEWLRIRFFILDTKTLDGYTCYLGDAESCQNSNFNSTEDADVYLPNDSLDIFAQRTDKGKLAATGARS